MKQMGCPMDELSPVGEQILAQINLDSSVLKSLEPRSKRTHYRAAINWLQSYRPELEQSKPQKFQHIIEACYHLCEAQDVERAFQIFSIQVAPYFNEKLYDQLYVWGHYDELKEIAQTVLRLLDTVVESERNNSLKVVCLEKLGSVEFVRGHYKESVDYYNRQMEISKLAQNLYWEASALIGLGQNFKLSGHTEAHKSYSRAQRIAIKLDDEKLEMAATSGLGNVQFDLGQYDLAATSFQEQLDIAIRTSNNLAKIQAFANLGEIHSLLGDHEAAVDTHLTALKITYLTENLEGEARVSALLGFAFYAQEEYRTAIYFYKRSLTISRSIGLFLQEAESLEKVGVLEGKLSDLPSARDSSLDHLNQALGLFRKAGISSAEARVLKEIAEVYADCGELESALKTCKEALKIACEQKLLLQRECVELEAKIIAKKAEITANALIKKISKPSGFSEIDLKQHLYLKSEIDIVLLTATDIELNAVRAMMEFYPKKRKKFTVIEGQETYYVGKFGAFKAVVTKCRMGTIGATAATLSTDRALRIWNPKAIIMVGIAFGRDSKKQEIGDVLIASEIIPYESQRRGADIQYRASIPPSNVTLLNRFENIPDWEFLNLHGSPCRPHIGAILSGEKLIDDPKFKSELFQQFPSAIGGEMEGSGLCSAAIGADVPWILVKSICDWADGTKGSDCQAEHQKLAASAAVSLVHTVLSQQTVLNFA
jgi:nucleoside phosphorylase/tetratricopeptide (TPR) repeat protein